MSVNRFGMIAAFGAALLLAPAPSHAAVVTYQAALDGPSEFPPNASPGTGLATATIDTVANIMRIQATFAGLLGNTTAAHIHCCTLDPPVIGTAAVATQVPTFVGFPLGVTSGSYDQTFDLTLASTYNPAFITANGGTTAAALVALLAGLGAGNAYFNIHTDLFRAGEIRGFLSEVPVPATLPLFATGLGALGILLWRRKRKQIAAA